MGIRTENIEESYEQISESIDIISEKIQTFCDKQRIAKEERTRVRIAVEECLLNWKNVLGNDTPAYLKMGNRIGKVYIKVGVISERAVNPYREDQERNIGFVSQILSNLGLSPSYSFKADHNEIKFSIEKEKMDPMKFMLIMIVIALGFGILTRLILPEYVINGLLDQILEPLSVKFFGVLGGISGPMIFLSVAWGLYGIGDIATLNKIGKKLIFKYLLTVTIAVLLVSPLFLVLGSGVSSSGEQLSKGGVFELILDIIPTNIITPFLEGNTLQIIILGVAVGLVMLYLEKQTSVVADVVEQVNYMVQFMIEIIGKLIPYFIFIVLVKLIWSGSYKVLGDIWLFAVVTIPALFAVMFLNLLYVSVKQRVSVVTLIKKTMPTFLIALSTASSAASFGTVRECCNDKYGINPAVSGFGIPLGFAFFKPVTSAYYLLLAFYFASVYDVKTTPVWIGMAICMAIILSMATPPVPGGTTAAYNMLFVHLGIPLDALAIALAVDIVFDFLTTAGNMAVLPNCLLDYAGKTNMLDRERIKKK